MKLGATYATLAQSLASLCGLHPTFTLDATSFMVIGRTRAFVFAYNPPVTPVPKCQAILEGKSLEHAFERANVRHVHIVVDDKLATAMSNDVAIGKCLPYAHYVAVAGVVAKMAAES